MKANRLPSKEYLNRTFTYDPESGDLYWKSRDDVPACVNSRFAGKVVGTPNSNGLGVRLNGISYAVHRIIYAMIADDILTDDDEIDHIDLCHFNNSWDNLRKVTHQQNMFNRNAQCNSSSGIKCIDILPSGKFRVRVSGLHIGCYSDMEDAVESAQDAILQFHREHGRLPLLP